MVQLLHLVLNIIKQIKNSQIERCYRTPRLGQCAGFPKYFAYEMFKNLAWRVLECKSVVPATFSLHKQLQNWTQSDDIM